MSAKLTNNLENLKSLIAATFPDIHWEVWGVDNQNPPNVFGGGVDGWQYRKAMLNATEGPIEAVIDQLHRQILDWYAESHPIRAAILKFRSTALTQQEPPHV